MKEVQNQRARESELRRQTAGGASPGSSRGDRLDPTALPLRYIARFDGDGRRRKATICLDREQAIIKCHTSLGVPLTICLPVSAFEGVAVRMSPIGEAGDIEVVLELQHRDRQLNLPLLVADDPADIAADWQAWGEVLNLPLLLVDHDGSVIVAGGRPRALAQMPTRQRRRHSFFADRRPRFLARRKKGLQGQTERLCRHEIIARD